MAKRKKTPDPDPRWNLKQQPAPGELRIVQAFVNTVDRDRGADLLTHRHQFLSWMELWGLAGPGTEVSQGDLERAVVARESLREMIAANNGASLRDATVTRLDQVVQAAELRVRIVAGGRVRFEAATGGLNGALARLFSIIAEVQANGTWENFKICQRQGCRAAFFDLSRNHSRRSCSRQCNSRLSSRTYRKRNLHRLRRAERETAWILRQGRKVSI